MAKFSQLEALKRLEKYLKLLENMSHLIRDIDLSNPRVQAFLDTGWVHGINNEFIHTKASCQSSVLIDERQHLGFSYFEFKIRLIRLGLSFQKQKFLYLNSQLTDS